MEQQNQQPIREKAESKPPIKTNWKFIAIVIALGLLVGGFFIFLFSVDRQATLQESQSTNEGFGIYLSEDDTLVISDEDIVSYKILHGPAQQILHEIRLTEDGVSKVKSLADPGATASSLDQQPFVIKLNAEEMYKGHFWTDLAAKSVVAYDQFAGPIITLDYLYTENIYLDRTKRSIYIDILHPFGGEYIGEDPRDNQKIVDYFRRIGKFVEDESESWEVYTDRKYGFEIKYPPGWVISRSQLNDDVVSVVTFREDYPFTQVITIEIVEKSTIEEFIEKENERVEKVLRSQGPNTTEERSITFPEEIIFAGQVVAKQESKAEGWHFKIITIPSHGLRIKAEVASEGDFKRVNQILTTFHLFEPIDTSDWQTYRNDEFGFEVRYPEGWIFEKNGISLFLSENDIISRANQDPHFHTFSMGIETHNANGTLEAYLKKRFNLKSLDEFKITPEESGYYIDWLKMTTLGGDIQSYFIHEGVQAFSICHFFAQHDNIIIEITRDGRYNCLDDPQFNQILSTFRFIN